MPKEEKPKGSGLFVYAISKDGTGQEFELDRNPDYGVGLDFIDGLDSVCIPVKCDHCGTFQVFQDWDFEVDEADEADERAMGTELLGHAGGDWECEKCKRNLHAEIRMNEYASTGGFFEPETDGCKVVVFHRLRDEVRFPEKPRSDDEEDGEDETEEEG